MSVPFEVLGINHWVDEGKRAWLCVQLLHLHWAFFSVISTETIIRAWLPWSAMQCHIE